jgi:hypothetical protein
MNDTQNPNYQSDEYAALRVLWAKVDACFEGTEAMRAARGLYLPQFPQEADDVYEQRVATSTFTPFYETTLTGITGTILRKSFQLGDKVPAAIVQDVENIDNAKTHIEVFGQRFLHTGVHYGAAYILVDMPQEPDVEVLDAEQASRINFRPFAVLYGAKELANEPRYVIIDGAPVLQLIVFLEESSQLDDFGTASAERFRVWRLPVYQDERENYHRAGNAEWEIWEKQTDASTKQDGFVLIDSGVSPLADIPVAVFNANPCLTNPMETEGPVLINLANTNIKHYQLESDHEHALHSCSPTAWTVNLRQDVEGAPIGAVGKVPYGNGVRWDLGENGSAGFAEPAGSGLERREKWIEKIERQMLDMGAALAMENSEKAGANTKIEATIRGGARTSRLTQIARAWQDAMEQALVFWGQWKGVWTDRTEEAEITLGVKDTDLVMAFTDTAAFSAMVEKHQLSLETFWALLQRGGILQDDFDAEDELQKIKKEKEMMTPPIPAPSFTQPGAIGQQPKVMISQNGGATI